MTQEFIFPVRVYYEDTDSGGLVYHANYLKFMERARTEYLRQFGYTYDTAHQNNILFVVHSAQIQYLKPAYHDALLHVASRVTKLGNACVMFEQIIQAADNRHIVFCVGNIKIACINKNSRRPCAIPQTLLAEIRRGT